MKKLITLLLSSILIFTACTSTAKQPESDSFCDTVSIHKNTDNYTDSIINGNYDNFSVSDDFILSVPDCSELGIYEVTCLNNFEKNSETLFSKYIPNYDETNVVSSAEGNDFKQVIYDDENYFSLLTSLGGFVISDKDCLNRVLYGDLIKFIRTDMTGKSKTQEYEIGGVKTTLQELVTTSKEFINDFVETTHYPNKITPFSISTQKLDDGTTAATMHCRSTYKGVPIFDFQSLHNEFTNKIAELTPIIFSFINGNKIGQFAVIHTFCDYKTVKLTDRVIPPDKAVELASEKLSGYMKLELQYEELVFFPTCNENRLSDTNGNGTKPGDIIKLTPYWVLYFNINWWHETFAMVNAETGEIEFINNAK